MDDSGQVGSMIDVPTGLRGIRDVMFLRCGEGQAVAAARATSGRDAGLLISGAGAVGTAKELRESYGFTGPVLLDALRYQHSGRLPAGAPFDPEWISDQRRLGIPVILTDSGYVGEHDQEGLESVLRRARALGSDVVATLPLHPSWLGNGEKLRALVRAVESHRAPIAVAVGRRAGPGAVEGVLDGLLTLFAATTHPVLLLHGGLSSLGALCFGAWAAAVDLSEVCPTPEYRAGSDEHGGPEDSESTVEVDCLPILLREWLSSVPLGRIRRAARDDPDLTGFLCHCHPCQGQDVHWMAEYPPSHARRAAFQHGIEILLELRDGTLGMPGDPDRDMDVRQRSWLAQCRNAEYRHAETAQFGWPRPRLPVAWWAAVEAAGSSHRDG